ncbi:NUDIX domain-containing protein [Niabella terrae]
MPVIKEKRNSKIKKVAAAVDCIVFGFDGTHLKILLIKRGFEPEQGKWSLMGGFIQEAETAEEAADRVLKKLTGLSGIYLEQFKTFSHPRRDPAQRTISIAYFALLDINKYRESITDEFESEWFPINDFPPLIFDHNEMVVLAKQRLQYKAASHTILFELLPEKFTLPLLQNLFEDVFNTTFDKGNFSRKMLSTKLLIKQKEKDKSNSKKGAYYYKIDKKHYQQNLHKILKLVPNPNDLI